MRSLADQTVEEMGGAVAAVESGYMKEALVSAHAARRARIEARFATLKAEGRAAFLGKRQPEFKGG